MTTLGTRLKQIRDKHNLNQADFAAKLGVGFSTYTRYEKDERVPDANLLSAIVQFDNAISERWLLTGRGEWITKNKQPDFFPIKELDIIQVHKIVYALLGQDDEIVELIVEDIFNNSLEDYKNDNFDCYDLKTLGEIVELTKNLPESLDKIEELKREWKQGYVYKYELKTLVKSWSNTIKKALDEEMQHLLG